MSSHKPKPGKPPLRWWVPGETEAIGIEKMFEAIARWDSLVAADARKEVKGLRAHVPSYLSTEEVRGAEQLIELALRSYPAATPQQLLWIFAAEAFRPRERGPKRKWSALEGANFVALVDAGLSAMGLPRAQAAGRRQQDVAGLRRVIAELRVRLPERYGDEAGYTEERLRQAYYEARATLAAPKDGRARTKKSTG